jgi:16S rRNA processing protein RimM
MKKADCFLLGYVAKLHGYKGEVSLFFDTTNPQDYAKLDALFIEVNGNLTPFFVESIQLGKKGFAKVRLEGVDTEESARRLLRNDIYLPLSILPELSGVHFYDHEVEGFKVVDAKYGEVGQLIQVVDYKINPLLRIQAEEDKEVLLPLIEGLVTKVDRLKQELHVSAPDGLIELYIEG